MSKKLLTFGVLAALCTTAQAYRLGEPEIMSEPGEPLLAKVPLVDIQVDGQSDLILHVVSDVDGTVNYAPEKNDAAYYVVITTTSRFEQGHRFVLSASYRDEARVREYQPVFPKPELAPEPEPVLNKGEKSFKLTVEPAPIPSGMEVSFHDDGKKKPSKPGEVIAKITYQVKRGDTSGTIARKMRKYIGGSNKERVAVIFEQNPHAFPTNTPDVITRGEVLVVQ